MGLLGVGSLCWNKLRSQLCYQDSSFKGSNFSSPYDFFKLNRARSYKIRALADEKSVKKLKRTKKAEKTLTQKLGTTLRNEPNEVEQKTLSEFDNTINDQSKKSSNENTEFKKDFVAFPSRETILQACTTTSGLIAALGLIIRQVSHVASVEGLSIPDYSSDISFDFETWHLQLIGGLVILISSCRYLLLNTWPDFAESSEAANQQVLSSLQPLDYIIVAFLPGISEELLFRGALLPLFGINLRSAMLVGALFGVLHLGSGRKYSFAIWATFVGFVYGYATIISSSLLVPMASHAANNLVGGLLWRYSSKSQK